MIRASGLQIAEHCRMAGKLAADYPETSKYATRGTNLHLEISTGRATSPEAKHALKWLEGRKIIAQERAVQLVDPETGEVLVPGTVDIAVDEDGLLVVGDFKSGQALYVTDPDTNPQLGAYALSLAMELGYDRYQTALLFLREDGVEEIRSRVIEAEEQWVMLERIKAIYTRPIEAVPGPWCNDCFQRQVCPSFRTRVQLALAIMPNANVESQDLPTSLTDETATAMLLRIKNLEEVLELAEAMVQAHVKRGGVVEANGKVWGPVQVAGRESADLAGLKKAGLTGYIKKGQPYEQWRWQKATGLKKAG